MITGESRGFSTEQEMVDFLMFANSTVNNTEHYLGGIMFLNDFKNQGDNFSEHIVFKIRLSSSPRNSGKGKFYINPFKGDTSWNTQFMFPLFQKVGPREPMDDCGGAPGKYNLTNYNLGSVNTLKGLITLFALNFWLLSVFFHFVDNTIMCHYLIQEVKWKRTFEVDKNIFILEPKTSSCPKKGGYYSCEHLYFYLILIKVPGIFMYLWSYRSDLQVLSTRIGHTRHNSADSVPTSNLVCIKEVATRTTFCITGIIYYTCNVVTDIQCTCYKMPSTNIFKELCVKISLLIMTVCNAVYCRLYIDLMHILPQVTTERFNGSHHPSFAKWYQSMCILYNACIGFLSILQCFIEFNPLPDDKKIFLD